MHNLLHLIQFRETSYQLHRINPDRQFEIYQNYFERYKHVIHSLECGKRVKNVPEHCTKRASIS